jgi:hypothetical protein
MVQMTIKNTIINKVRFEIGRATSAYVAEDAMIAENSAARLAVRYTMLPKHGLHKKTVPRELWHNKGRSKKHERDKICNLIDGPCCGVRSFSRAAVRFNGGGKPNHTAPKVHN